MRPDAPFLAHAAPLGPKPAAQLRDQPRFKNPADDGVQAPLREGRGRLRELCGLELRDLRFPGGFRLHAKSLVLAGSLLRGLRTTGVVYNDTSISLHFLERRLLSYIFSSLDAGR